MGSLFGLSLVTLLAIGLAQAASAQDSTAAQPAPAAATMPLSAPGVLTGKERLGRKWMDEQRIDNCNVPSPNAATSRGRAPARMFRPVDQPIRRRRAEPSRTRNRCGSGKRCRDRLDRFVPFEFVVRDFGSPPMGLAVCRPTKGPQIGCRAAPCGWKTEQSRNICGRRG
jgi:hypothetical protein